MIDTSIHIFPKNEALQPQEVWMPLYCYFSPACQEDAKKHSCHDRVEKLVEKVEEDQKTNLFESFPPPYYTKKKFPRKQYRLIAEARTFGEDTVLCLLCILKKDRSYNQYSEAPKEYADQHFKKLVTDEEVAKWLEERKAVKPPPLPPEMTPAEKNFLWESLDKKDEQDLVQDYFICETEEWVQTLDNLPKEDLGSFLNDLYPFLEWIIDDRMFKNKDWQSLKFSQGDQRVIAKIFPTYKKILLFSVYPEHESEIATKIQEKYRDHLEEQISSVWDILKITWRSYPKLLFDQKESWKSIQQDTTANLALSPEEAKILVSAQSSNGENSGYPLFINGRAGSGKSTILQHLFAEYFRYWWKHFGKNNLDSRPLFFSCSQGLVEHAQKVVTSLLTTSWKSQLHKIEVKDDLQETLPHSFAEFRSYLLQFLLTQEQNKLFGKRQYVDYSRFRHLWKEKFGNEPKADQNYGPQISWHIIRSFIKGRSVEDYLEPDDYNQLARDEKTVSKETFSLVYEKVWANWYQHLKESERYWDDQDLVRYILSNKALEEQHVAIFCDEAQDFTRIELEILLQLCRYSRRLLEKQDVNRVPFVFAGDPFQTLNPTGFRWEAIKSAFVEKISKSLHPGRSHQGIPDLNYRELQYNYRSTANVVLLCNSIQLLRALLLDITSIQPQTNWLIEKKGPYPYYFNLSDPNLKEELTKQKDLRIIVPCGDDEEATFVKNDPFLKEWVEIDDETGVPQNVFSPIRAKGLEFRRVLLYGFGMHRQFDWEDLVKNKDSDRKLEEILPMEYFINSLYVAASRPQRRLFVLDTEEGLEKFWKFTQSKDLLDQLAEQTKKPEEWKDKLGQLYPGRPIDLSREREDTSKIAEQDEADGMDQESSYLLIQAAQAYEQAFKFDKALECRAWADRFDGNFLQSGERFLKLDQHDLALEVFWEGGHYQPIVQLAANNPSFQDRLEVQAAQLIETSTEEFTLEPVEKLFNSILKNHSQEKLGLETLLDLSWTKALERILVLALQNIQLDDPVSQQVVSHLDQLAQLGLNITPLDLAKAYYLTGHYQRAVDIWEEEEYTSSEEYQQAKVLILLEKMKEDSDIEVSSEEAKRLGKHFLDRGDHAQGGEWFYQAGDLLGLEQCLVSSLEEGEGAENNLSRIYSLTMENGQWHYLIDLTKQGKLKTEIEKDKKKELLQQIESSKVLYKEVIPQIAFTRKYLSDTSWKVKKRLAEYLTATLIPSGDETETTWEAVLYPEVAGAALEATEREVEGLKFYQYLIDREKDVSWEEMCFYQSRHLRIRLNRAKRTKRVKELLDKVSGEMGFFGLDLDDLGPDRLDKEYLKEQRLEWFRKEQEEKKRKEAEEKEKAEEKEARVYSPDDWGAYEDAPEEDWDGFRETYPSDGPLCDDESQWTVDKPDAFERDTTQPVKHQRVEWTLEGCHLRMIPSKQKINIITSQMDLIQVFWDRKVVESDDLEVGEMDPQWFDIPELGWMIDLTSQDMKWVLVHIPDKGLELKIVL